MSEEESKTKTTEERKEEQERKEVSQLEHELEEKKVERESQRGIINRIINGWKDRRYDVSKCFVLFLVTFSFMLFLNEIRTIEGYGQRRPKSGLLVPRETQGFYFFAWHKKADSMDYSTTKADRMLFLQEDDLVVTDIIHFIILPKRKGFTFSVNITATKTVEKEFGSEKRLLWYKDRRWSPKGKVKVKMTIPHIEKMQRCSLTINGRDIVDFDHKSHPKSTMVEEMTYAEIYSRTRIALLIGLMFGMGGGTFGVWAARFSVSPEPNRLLGIVTGILLMITVFLFTNYLYMTLGITTPLANLAYFIPAFFFGVLTGADASKAMLCQHVTAKKKWNAWMVFAKVRGNTKYETPGFWEWLTKHPEPVAVAGEIKNQRDTSLLERQEVTHTVLAKREESFAGKKYIVPFKKALLHVFGWMENFLKIDRLVKAYDNINEAYYELKSTVATRNYEKARDVLIQYIEKMDEVTSDFELPSLKEKVKELERTKEEKAREQEGRIIRS